MSNQPLDERPHQPTPAKLRRLRLKGDVAISQDFATGFQFVFMLLAASMLWEYQLDGFEDAILFHLNLITTLQEEAEPNWDLIISAVKPALGLSFICILATVTAKFIDVRGIVLNTQGLTPSFNQLNPVSGIKEIFSLNSTISFGKSFVKFAIMTVALVLAVIRHANDAVWTPACGVGCQASLGLAVIQYLMATYLLVIIFFALIDFRLSRFLHRRKHRMSKKELRQEQKDNNISPEMRGEMARFRSDGLEDSPEQQNSVNLIVSGATEAHAIFVYNSAPPIIIQTAGKELIDQAKQAGVRIVYDEFLSRQLSEYPIRTPLPKNLALVVQKALQGG